jgi:hypothetical protein
MSSFCKIVFPEFGEGEFVSIGIRKPRLHLRREAFIENAEGEAQILSEKLYIFSVLWAISGELRKSQVVRLKNFQRQIF